MNSFFFSVMGTILSRFQAALLAAWGPACNVAGFGQVWGQITTGARGDMRFKGLDDLKKRGAAALAKGPIALILIEDRAEIETTLRHHLDAGFKSVLAFVPAHFRLPGDLEEMIHRVDYEPTREQAAHCAVVNTVIPLAQGQWLYYGFNAEYLFFPFCETRNIAELLTFHTEEKRDAMLAYVIDLYAGDLDKAQTGVDLKDCYLDGTGYYALARPDPENHNHPKERQLDFYGGLHWRFEEHIPKTRRKIDRIALFRAKPGLELRPDHTFTDEEYNTYACPWHHNLTAAVVSFRTAKALKRNPGSSFDIHSFKWHKSVKFDWDSRQLMELDLMEPGQWF